ncbi:UNKNOWN [Stylonychia lemnae]|uniref:Uncharacterized protein n=1 Tax=Stylonychia lemnae TaxID=5949 RepID=A0A078AA53_STYLE|nr:UNKNOWN [Stylonychia lemnae]|eukprot:CDW77693.1 UNKNOWN [Stylonychia lemnae]
MESFDNDDGQISLDQKYNEGHFMSLLKCLEEIESLDERNQMFYVEVIRNLSEFVVYSEKFKKNYFDIFCERNTLESFVSILNMNNRFANMQLIQTSSIFLQNIDQMTKKSIKFYNHPEMMVRNAIRIIALTIFKLNEDSINTLLMDLPFCQYFANLSCYFRDKILDLDQSYASTHSPHQNKGKPQKNQELLSSSVEELQDMMEFFQEVFEVDNKIVSDMLANCLLHYCYLPVVVGSLVCIQQKPIISISTSQYVLIQALINIKYQPFTNVLVASLLLQEIPKVIKREVEIYPEVQPQNYKYKWMMKLPFQYTKKIYIQENFNDQCLELFLEDQKYPCLKSVQEKIQDISPEIRYENETRQEFNQEIYKIIQETLTAEDLRMMEEDHYGLSQALGHPVGLINDTKKDKDYDKNDGRIQFLHFLKSKDDNLILLTCCTLYSILTISKCFRRKNLLLQKLINTTDVDRLDLSPRKKQNLQNQRLKEVENMELEFQKHILNSCNGIIYDSEIIENLINLLSNDPPFRMITIKLICSIICHLTYNKKLECSLSQINYIQLKNCYGSSINCLQKQLLNPQISENLPEMIEEEWLKFKFVEQSEIENLISDPLIMLPSIDDKSVRKMPQALSYPIKEMEIIRLRIKLFLSLRHMIFNLTMNDGSVNIRLKENPIKKGEREISKWVQGNSYEISANNELILCNIRKGTQMMPCYFLQDQDFFIIIQSDFSKDNEYRVKVLVKVPLKLVQSAIDRTEARNLIIAYPDFQNNNKQGKPNVEEMLIYFENTMKCSFVKNKIDISKTTSQQVVINRVNALLEKCLNITQPSSIAGGNSPNGKSE